MNRHKQDASLYTMYWYAADSKDGDAAPRARRDERAGGVDRLNSGRLGLEESSPDLAARSLGCTF